MDVKPTGQIKGGQTGYDFTKSLTEGKRFNFGPRDSSTIAVDLSLANLFQKLTVECSGILANPQWKHWRHMEMLKKDQIRLSNGIWRSWHIQFQKGKFPLFCSFVLDPDADSKAHKEPQAIVIEGKYWKRSTQAVANEYRKWRMYYYIKQKKQKSLNKGSDGVTQYMQVDTTDNSNIFQTLEEAMFPRQDERTYMRPLLAGGIDVMQPSLEMLNPSLEELLDRLEPMEVMFPSFTNTSLTRPSNPPTCTDSYYSQYGAQPSYEVSSTKPIGIPNRETSSYHGNYNPDYGMSPSAFLNPVGSSRDRGDSMDIGTPPTRGVVMKDTNGPSKLDVFNKPYPQQQTTPTNSMYPQMMGGATAVGQPPMHSFLGQMNDDSAMYGSQAPLQHTDHTPTVPPIDPTHYPYPVQQQRLYNNDFPRKLSNTSIDSPSPTPVMDDRHDNSQSDMVMGEPQINFIAEQMKKMEEEQLHQIQEIDKQQELATQQYLQLVHQYVAQSGDQPSQHQQQILTSALSDPSTVEILKFVLLQGGGVTTPPPSTPVADISIKQESPNQENLAPPISVPKLVTPKHLAKAAGVSDFQSRIVMAAAAQVNTSTGSASVSPFTSGTYTPEASHRVDITSPATPTIKSPTGELDISHALMKKFKNARNLSSEEKRIYQELRRQTHISAEQKRRGSIKYGFDQLQSFVINPSQHPTGKVSKAVILEKTLEHIHQQHSDRDARERNMVQLQEELRQLNEAIVLCQQRLPASGAPVTRQRFEENRQKFKEYVQSRTQQNYKFWIYSIILQQLFDSYNSSVSTGSVEELCQTVLTWFEQNCSLPSLRPVVLNSLKELSMKTSILSDPSKVPQQLSSYRDSQ